MLIETKYSPGDVVFYATVGDTSIKTDCSECSGSGRLRIEGKDYTIACRDCHGRGFHYRRQAAAVSKQYTVGHVRVEITDSPGTDNQWGDVLSTDGDGFTNYSPIQKREEQYMCIETGIGSGSVYPVEDLFPTEPEAFARAQVKLAEWQRRVAEQEEREQKERENYAREFAAEEADELA